MSENGAVNPTGEQDNISGAAQAEDSKILNTDVKKLQQRVEMLEAEKQELQNKHLSEIASYKEMAARRKRQKEKFELHNQNLLLKHDLEDEDLDEILSKYAATLTEAERKDLEQKKLENKLKKIETELNQYRDSEFKSKKTEFVHGLIQDANILTSKFSIVKRLFDTFVEDGEDGFVLKDGSEIIDKEEFIKRFVEQNPELVASKAKPGVSFKNAPQNPNSGMGKLSGRQKLINIHRQAGKF